MKIKSVVRSFLIVSALTLAILMVMVCLCINLIMFHPVGSYDGTCPGYVDIGTNGIRIAAVARGVAKGRKVILHCHGNAEDMIQSLDMYAGALARGYGVAAVDYPGYGLSDGSPSEGGCYRNVHRLYDWLVEVCGVRPEDVIVVGFSIGTGPATELAATQRVGGLVLMAPYLSAPRIVTRIRLLPIDPFPNLERIARVDCPVTVIHGTEDRIIPFAHGRRLFALANEPKRFLAVEGAGHNDLAIRLGAARLEDLFPAISMPSAE